MKHIECTRDTNYGDKQYKAGKVYTVGRDKDVTDNVAMQMVSNRTGVEHVKHFNPVEETKVEKPEETKALEDMTKKELVAYAEGNEITVTQVNSKQRILEEIQVAEKAKADKNEELKKIQADIDHALTLPREEALEFLGEAYTVSFSEEGETCLLHELPLVNPDNLLGTLILTEEKGGE